MLYLGGLRKGSGQAPPVTARKSKAAFLLELCHTFSVPYCYRVARFLSTHLDPDLSLPPIEPARAGLFQGCPWNQHLLCGVKLPALGRVELVDVAALQR